LEAQLSVGVALGGEAGARLSASLAMPLSPDTLLRLIRKERFFTVATPRVLGVDDWAMRKGRTCGTILVDLEKHRVVDLLPDRTSETLLSWLREHSGVEVFTRAPPSTPKPQVKMCCKPNKWQIVGTCCSMCAAMLERYLLGVYKRLEQPGVQRKHVHRGRPAKV